MLSGRHGTDQSKEAVLGRCRLGRGGEEENKGALRRHTGISSGVELIKARPVGGTHMHTHTHMQTYTQANASAQTHTHTH